MMDLESAIRHCEEVAEEQEKLYRLCPASESDMFRCDGTKDCITLKNGKNKGCQKCAEEHRQLAEWLKELKAYRENTCGDAISRQSAIFIASDLKQDLPDDERIADMVMAHNEGILEYQTQLSLLPSVTPQPRTGRWIPVSERVPEDGEEVLCCLGSEEMAVLFRRNDWGQDEWVDGGFATGSYDVVAWMPLPKPYKTESEVDS